MGHSSDGRMSVTSLPTLASVTSMPLTVTWSAASVNVTGTLPVPVEWGAGAYVGLVVRVVQTLLTIVLNLGGVVVLLYGKTWRLPKGVLLIALIANDFLLATVTMPIATWAYVMGEAASGSFLCRETGFFVFPAINSMFCLTLLCLDRFVAIRAPYWYLRYVTSRRGALLVAAQWAVIVVYTSVRAVFEPKRSYNTDLQICNYSSAYSSKSLQRPILISLCYLFMMATSVYVYYVAHRHRRQMAAQDRISGTGIQVDDQSILAEFKVVLYIVLAFILSGVPGLLFSLPPGVATGLKPYLAWSVYSNALLNIVIYGFKTRNFRESFSALVQHIKRKLHTKKQVTPNVSVLSVRRREENATQKPEVHVVNNLPVMPQEARQNEPKTKEELNTHSGEITNKEIEAIEMNGSVHICM